MNDYFSLSPFSTQRTWHIYTNHWTFRITQTTYNTDVDERAHAPYLVEVKSVDSLYDLRENWVFVASDGPMFNLDAAVAHAKQWLAAH